MGYLRDLGWEELYLRAGHNAPPDEAEPGDGAPAPQMPEAGEMSRSREELLARVASEAATCEACALSRGRRTVVFGSGNPDADLMFIGEGPGEQEDRQGLPFVGPAGELLTRIIEAIELHRDDVYIANVVKCRPPGNRDPKPDEIAACRHYLERQVHLVRPRVIVALGRVAAQTLLGNDLPLGRMRGQWYRFLDTDLRVTYHPAALLRSASYKRPTWEDMQIVRDRLRESRS